MATFAQFFASRMVDNPTIDMNGGTISPPGLAKLLDGVAITYSGQVMLTGGVWLRPLKPYATDDPKGATPQAFTSSGKILPCAVVRNEPKIKHPGFGAPDNAILGSVAIYLYGQSHAQGKTVLESVSQRCEQLFRDWYFTTSNGTTAFVDCTFERDPEDNHDEFPGSVLAIIRYAVVALK